LVWLGKETGYKEEGRKMVRVIGTMAEMMVFLWIWLSRNYGFVFSSGGGEIIGWGRAGGRQREARRAERPNFASRAVYPFDAHAVRCRVGAIVRFYKYIPQRREVAKNNIFDRITEWTGFNGDG
jgi:hypothetical protein